MGVEPTYAAWEAAVLPMNYIRKICVFLSITQNPLHCNSKI